jgi:endonuclease/exonuclease/phosphatase family metal-dependent hydrolase
MTDFNSRNLTTDFCSIESATSILGISRVFEHHEGKTGRIFCHPHFTQRSKPLELALDFILVTKHPQVTDVHFGPIRIAVSSGHTERPDVEPLTAGKSWYQLATGLV